MFTLALVSLWAGLGLIVGMLALAARLKPKDWRVSVWLLVPGLSAALLGGLLGFWLLGRLFSSTTALWFAILATCIPRLYERLRN